MKRISVIILLIILIVIPATAYVDQDDNTLIKEYEFIADSTDFDYKAEEEIRSDGTMYQLKGIKRYKVIGEKKHIEKTVSFTNLKEKNIPTSRSFTVDGERVNLKPLIYRRWRTSKPQA